MPYYLYESGGVVKEIFQHMNEEHSYEENGIKWNRVFCVPQSNIDTKIDPFSSREFSEKTGKKSGTYGDLLDRSKELSEKRKGNSNYDPIQRKHWEDYSKKRRGIKCEEQKKAELKEKFASNKFIEVS